MLVGHFMCGFRTVVHEASRVNALDLCIQGGVIFFDSL